LFSLVDTDFGEVVVESVGNSARLTGCVVSLGFSFREHSLAIGPEIVARSLRGAHI